ncbi:MAG TPA: hypothetical protein VMH31_10585 [Methylomirabilota bacterium]|nr:hypothetical protein [Methylomirabilota bacterium]
MSKTGDRGTVSGCATRGERMPEDGWQMGKAMPVRVDSWEMRTARHIMGKKLSAGFV